jgi:hypothetical protein
VQSSSDPGVVPIMFYAVVKSRSVDSWHWPA